MTRILQLIAFLQVMLLCSTICSNDGDSYLMVEGSVPTDYFAVIKHTYYSYYTGSSYQYNCYYSYSYPDDVGYYYHKWLLEDGFIVQQFQNSDLNLNLKQNSYTIDMGACQSTSAQASYLNTYINAVYNSFEGCLVSIQFMPDISASQLVVAFTIHTIKNHLNENTKPVTEFFAVKQIVTTVNSNSHNVYEDTYGATCDFAFLFYVNALKKFAYIQNQLHRWYWVVTNYALDGTEAGSNPCNENYVSTANTSTPTLYAITIPWATYGCLSVGETVNHIQQSNVAIYGKYAYYFVREHFHQCNTYYCDCYYGNTNYIRSQFHTKDLSTGTETIEENYGAEVWGTVCHIADYGIAFTRSDCSGYFIAPINSANGRFLSSSIQVETSYSWKLLQTRLGKDSYRPLFGVSSQYINTLYRITTTKAIAFQATGHDFFNYQTDIGAQNLLVVYPGQCANSYIPESDGTHVKLVVIKIDTGVVIACRMDIVYCNSNDLRGNGITNSGEECDDGNLVGGDGCSASLIIEDGYRCDNSQHTRSLCPRTKCGNNYLETYSPELEVCDDGNLNDTDGCTKYCKRTDGYFCPWPSLACYKVCPDGILNKIPGLPDNYYNYTSEVCDEGTAPASGGCADYCFRIVQGWECLAPNQACRKICGNHILDVYNAAKQNYSEQCDLGTSANNGASGCTAGCQIVTDWGCKQPAVSCSPLCGNGDWDNFTSGPGGPHYESCDDGNIANGDGCNSNCVWESVIRTKDFGYTNYSLSNEVWSSSWLQNSKDACVQLYATHQTGNYTLPDFIYSDYKTFVFAEVYGSGYMFCHTGVFCDDCQRGRFPGYPIIHKAPNPDEMAYQAHNNRGRFFFTENADNDGFAVTMVYNDKTFFWQSNSGQAFPTATTHSGIGAVRLSVGKYYFENNGERSFTIKRLDVTGTDATLVNICTSEADFGIPPMQGNDFFIWWPNYEILLSRQFNGRQMDVFKFNPTIGASTGISCKNTDFNNLKHYFSDIYGELSVYPVFLAVTVDSVVFTKMYLYRKITNYDGTVSRFISKYDWYVETGVIYEEAQIPISNDVWDMVAFDTGVLVVTSDSTYIITSASDTLQTATLSIASAATGKKWRFFQKRPDPDKPTPNPQVYAYYIEEDYHKNFFHKVTYTSPVTVSINDNADGTFTLPIRYHTGGIPGLDNFKHNLNEGYILINPFDIGVKYMAILQIHPCANSKPTHMLDFWEDLSLGIYKLETQTIVQCVDLTTALGLTMTNPML